MMRIVNRQELGKIKKSTDVTSIREEMQVDFQSTGTSGTINRHVTPGLTGNNMHASHNAAHDDHANADFKTGHRDVSDSKSKSSLSSSLDQDPIAPSSLVVDRQTNKTNVEQKIIEQGVTVQAINHALAHPNPTTQLLLSSKVIIHRPEAGLNPLVDAAAHLFSVMGKLKRLKTHQNLDKLRTELVHDIENFVSTIQAYNYKTDLIPEYVLLSRYAICITLDDIILGTPWGGQRKWDKYSLVAAFDQEPLSHQNFLIILERLVRDPSIYIDLMEFMYICLSLGFRCHYNSSEFDHEQLEHITNALYKRIRSYRGNFSKTLSPFSLRPLAQFSAQSPLAKIPAWLTIGVATICCATFLVGGKYLLNRTFNHVSQRLTQTEMATYAKNNATIQ